MFKKMLLFSFILYSTMGISFAQELPCACAVSAYFTPTESIEKQVINLIKSSTKTIRISSYGIQNQDIVNALIEQKKVGVDIIACEDKIQANSKGSLLNQLSNAGIKIVKKKTGVLEHNKFMIVDNATVILGSYNFSKNANKQDNSDVILMNCPDLIKKFQNQWQMIYQRDAL